MQYQDYYKIPAISRDTTAEEIKKSFHKFMHFRCAMGQPYWMTDEGCISGVWGFINRV
jgi:hypothetical protein